jgi:hypothetical protein
MLVVAGDRRGAADGAQRAGTVRRTPVTVVTLGTRLGVM